MPRPKKEEKKFCCWKNLCAHKYTCCNFCTVKTCEYRCKDSFKTCKYLTDVDGAAVVPTYDAKPIDIEAVKPKKSKAEKEKKWIAENARTTTKKNK